MILHKSAFPNPPTPSFTGSAAPHRSPCSEPHTRQSHTVPVPAEYLVCLFPSYKEQQLHFSFPLGDRKLSATLKDAQFPRLTHLHFNNPPPNIFYLSLSSLFVIFSCLIARIPGRYFTPFPNKIKHKQTDIEKATVFNLLKHLLQNQSGQCLNRRSLLYNAGYDPFSFDLYKMSQI